jgi:hypothetical protein
MGEYNAYTDTFTPSGGTSLDISGSTGTMTHHGSTEVQLANAFVREGDAMSTVTSPQGSPLLNREPGPNDLITFDGFKMTCAMAAQMGYLVRTPSGSFETTEQGYHSGPQAAAQTGEVGLASGGTAEEGTASGFAADGDTESILSEVISRSNPDTQRNAIEQVLANGGAVDQNTINALASEMGIEPDLAAGAIHHAAAGVEKAVYSHLADHGVFDQDAFARFVHSSPKNHGAMIAAARDLMSTNSTAGFEAMAQEFRATADQHAPQEVADALNDAGIPFQITKGGQFVLDMRHSGKGTMAFRQAVELGLITLHKNN